MHPALPKLQELYAGQEATFVHEVASRYRDRSHFDAQNVPETGAKSPYLPKDGWMSRLHGMLPRSGKGAVAFAPAVPLAMQGAVAVTTYAPSTLALEKLMASTCAEAFNLGPQRTTQVLFPDADRCQALPGLLRS